VAVSLALDPRDRYQTAREMRRALSDGAQGIPPGEPTRGSRAAPLTQATSVLSAGRRPAAPAQGGAGAVAPRRPRPGPPRTKPPLVASAAPAPRRDRRGRGRLLAALLALLGVALVIIAAFVLTAPEPTKIVLRNVVYSDVHEASAALQQLVSENTK
jgi:hypothetical protein